MSSDAVSLILLSLSKRFTHNVPSLVSKVSVCHSYVSDIVNQRLLCIT